MRHCIAFSICLVAMAANSQQKADIEVSYRYSHPVQTMRSAEADITTDNEATYNILSVFVHGV